MVGFATWKTFCRAEDDFLDTPGPLLSAVLWPISIIVLLPPFVFKMFESLKFPEFSSKAEQRVKEYSESPTKILTALVCSKIIAYPEGFDLCFERWKSEDKTIVVPFSYYSNDIQHDPSRNRISVNNKWIKLESSEFDSLIKCLRKVKIINERKEAQSAKTKAQLAALDAVEFLLSTPAKKDESPLTPTS